MSSGPFDLAPLDAAIICVGAIAATDTTTLKVLSDSAQVIYEQHLGVQSHPPVQFPMTFILSQNLPNPFTQVTTIRYQLTRPGLVSLRVYNVAGQMVRTVVSSALPAGWYSATWDGRDEGGRKVSAGVYLYQLQVGDRALTRKMVLVR